jgi:hypothetical protein
LEGSLKSLEAALARRIGRAEKERDRLKAELEGYRNATSGGRGGGGRYALLLAQMEEIKKEGDQVERDLRRLGSEDSGRRR